MAYSKRSHRESGEVFCKEVRPLRGVEADARNDTPSVADEERVFWVGWSGELPGVEPPTE